MHLSNLRPFVPSGQDFVRSRAFFLDLGFVETWGTADLCELQMGQVTFLLQNYANRELQENLMLSVTVDDLDAFWKHLNSSGVLDKYDGVQAKAPAAMPWGTTELHLIDPAGVCWHFSE